MIDFHCTDCDHKTKTLKSFKACPHCGNNGFNLIHSWPVLYSDGISLKRRNNHEGATT